MIPAPRLTGPRKPERAPHAIPVWALAVEDDEPDETLAELLVAAAAIVVIFVIVFVLLPA